MLRKKYGNKKTIIDGIEFDSVKESNRYKELRLLEKIKMISNLELQPEFVLQESFKIGKETHRAIKYIADFKYYDSGRNCIVVEDVKGMKTEVYKIKKKLLLWKFAGICFREI